MRFRCVCGRTLSNSGVPNAIEHLFISSYGIEKLQDLVDVQSEENRGPTDDWPENWEDSEAIEVWKCSDCQRLYFSPSEGFESTVVYKVEQIGI